MLNFLILDLVQMCTKTIGASSCFNTSTKTRSLWSNRCSLKTTTICMSMSITSSSSSSPTKTNTIVPAVIIGDHRVAGILENIGDGNDVMLMPGEAIPTHPPGPIFVCCTVPGVKKVIKAIPLSRLKDLVFFQIGMIGTSLTIEIEDPGKLDDQTTDINPDEFNAAYGKWASAIATRFESRGRPCKVEKLISELASAAAAEKGTVFEQGMEERIFAYSRVNPDMPIQSRYVGAAVHSGI